MRAPSPHEAAAVAALRARLEPIPAWLPQARPLAHALTRATLAQPHTLLDVQRWLGLFPIDTPIGESLFRLAEALPRTPDAGNQSELLKRLPGMSLPLAPAIARPAARAALATLGRQFVFGQTIERALARARRNTPPAPGVRSHSFDMLGEGARTHADASANFARYLAAIRATGADAARIPGGPRDRAGVSVKVSAIHPRYEASQYPHIRAALLESLCALCRAAAAADIGLTIDAEESERLALHLDLFAALAADPALAGWSGPGLVVQAYHVQAIEAIETVLTIARRRQAQGGGAIAVRLVKGAYWDAEIRRAQELGLDHYPVFTAKGHTDLAYLACARALLDHRHLLYPQFATHNPVSAACVLALAGAAGEGDAMQAPQFEFQRLHGMGEALASTLAEHHPHLPVRAYAPVGAQDQLLAYLVRRLLENGASTSYVRQAAATHDATRLADSGLACLSAAFDASVPRFTAPREITMPERIGARGANLNDAGELADTARRVAQALRHWRAAPIIDGKAHAGSARTVASPAHPGRVIGEVAEAGIAQVRAAVDLAHASRSRWASTPVSARAACLDRLADLLEHHRDELMALCVHEAGKTLPDALAEVREAVDFCRYYAAQARERFGSPLRLPGCAGEVNTLTWHGRGVFACISPWNFPLAIFTGQVAAALVAGNTVVAKPAGQTPLSAQRVTELMFEAGIPSEVLQLLPGDGAIGAALVADPRIAGVAFTGSTATARLIGRALARKEGPIVPLIAETGGLNAMIVDSTALPEQVVDAVIASAFRSAGQRCSSLRMLYLQEEIAPQVITMLAGATAALRMGDPADPATDVGPVIDAAARAMLDDYIAALHARGAPLAQARLPAIAGHFVAPVAFQVDSIADLPGERFGPVLHVARFAIDRLDRVIGDINAAGYGLTLGIHTRIDARAAWIRARVAVGNVYVNRNMIGAVVGQQPFGGEGLSGTGPKAGGPHYLLRFATERVTTVNTAAAGGDLALMSVGPQAGGAPRPAPRAPI